MLENLYQEEIYALPPRVVVVLDREWDQCTPDEQTLLQKIIASVRLTLDKIVLVSRPAFDLDTLLPLNPSHLLFFGAFNTDHPRYQRAEEQGIPVVFADALGTLDDQRKKNLWLALRPTFGV